MSFLWLTWFACRLRDEGSQSPPRPVDLTYTDFDGQVWTGTNGVLERFQATGPDCAPARWYQVNTLDPPDLGARICLPEDGQVQFADGRGGAHDADAELQGEIGSVVVEDPDQIVYEIDGGCVKDLRLSAPQPNDCFPQDGTATVEIDGPIDDWNLQEVDGVPGYATDPETGDAICALELSSS